MTDKAYEVIAKALEQFETCEFDSVAVVMLGKNRESYFSHLSHDDLRLMGALNILTNRVAIPIMRRLQAQDEEAEPEQVDEH